MLTCSRREALRLLQTRCSATPTSLHSALTRLSDPKKLQFIRTARTKPRRNETFLERANREDELLLKKLEAQMDRAKSRAAKYDEIAAKLMERQAPDRTSGQELEMDLDAFNKFFWDKVLTKQDKADLGAHNIYTFKDLSKAYEEAMTVLLKHPETSVESLNPRLQYAHEVYESIADRVAAAKQSTSQTKPKPKSRSFLGKFF